MSYFTPLNPPIHSRFPTFLPHVSNNSTPRRQYGSIEREREKETKTTQNIGGKMKTCFFFMQVEVSSSINSTHAQKYSSFERTHEREHTNKPLPPHVFSSRCWLFFAVSPPIPPIHSRFSPTFLSTHPGRQYGSIEGEREKRK